MSDRFSFTLVLAVISIGTVMGFFLPNIQINGSLAMFAILGGMGAMIVVTVAWRKLNLTTYNLKHTAKIITLVVLGNYLGSLGKICFFGAWEHMFMPELRMALSLLGVALAALLIWGDPNNPLWGS